MTTFAYLAKKGRPPLPPFPALSSFLSIRSEGGRRNQRCLLLIGEKRRNGDAGTHRYIDSEGWRGGGGRGERSPPTSYKAVPSFLLPSRCCLYQKAVPPPPPPPVVRSFDPSARSHPALNGSGETPKEKREEEKEGRHRGNNLLFPRPPTLFLLLLLLSFRWHNHEKRSLPSSSSLLPPLCCWLCVSLRAASRGLDPLDGRKDPPGLHPVLVGS